MTLVRGSRQGYCLDEGAGQGVARCASIINIYAVRWGRKPLKDE